MLKQPKLNTIQGLLDVFVSHKTHLCCLVVCYLKNHRQFSVPLRGCSVIYVGSGGALTVWTIFDFELPKHFKIAIVATITALKHLKNHPQHFRTSENIVETHLY